jgi:hypothetical protein
MPVYILISVVIDLVGDMKFTEDPDTKKVIVFTQKND